MAMSFVNVATWTDITSPTTFTFNKPASIQAGDILIAFVCAPSTGSVGAPTLSGWTHIYDGIGNFGSGSDTFSAAWWRVVDGTEPSSWTSGTFSGGGVTANTVVAAYRGVNPFDPFVAWDQSVPGGMGTNPLTDNPSITVEDIGGWVVNFIGYRSSASSTTSSHNLGFTERSDVSAGTSSTFETVTLYDSNGQFEPMGGVFCQVTSTQTAVSGGTWTAQLRPADAFPALDPPKLRDYTSTSNTGSSTLTHSTMPVHRTGDLLLWITSAAKASGSFATTATSGWTQLAVQNSGSGTGIHQQQVWYKFATSSSETGPTITLGGTGTSNLGIISHMTTWRYVDAAPTVFAGNSGTTSTTFASASVTTTTNNCSVVRAATIRDGSTTPTITWPGTETLINTINCSTSASVGTTFNGRMTQSVARDEVATAGSTGVVNATISSGAPTSFAGIATALSNSFRSGTDAGSGADAYLATTVPDTDTGSGADTATFTVQGPSAATDSGSGADTANVAAHEPVSDTGSGLDTASVQAGALDSGGGADNAVVIVKATGDAGSGSDTADSYFAAVDSDSGSAADTAFVSNAVGSNDTGSGADTATVRITAADAGAGADFAIGIGQDAANGADNANVIVQVTGDVGSGADNASSTNAVAVSDSGSGSDSGKPVLPVTDAGSGVDAGSLTAAAPVSDSGSVTENATVIIQQPDSFSGADNGNVGFAVADTGSGADTAILRVTIFGSDTYAGADNGQIALSDTDSATSFEASFKAISGILQAPRKLTVPSESRTLVVAKEPRTRTPDPEGRLILIGAEPVVYV